MSISIQHRHLKDDRCTLWAGLNIWIHYLGVRAGAHGWVLCVYGVEGRCQVMDRQACKYACVPFFFILRAQSLVTIIIIMTELRMPHKHFNRILVFAYKQDCIVHHLWSWKRKIKINDSQAWLWCYYFLKNLNEMMFYAKYILNIQKPKICF